MAVPPSPLFVEMVLSRSDCDELQAVDGHVPLHLGGLAGVQDEVRAVLAVEGVEQPPHLRAVAQVAVGEPVLAGDALQFTAHFKELRGRRDLGQPPVVPQYAGLARHLRVVKHHERVRVQRQRKHLAVELALLPDSRAEVLRPHPELRQQVQVPGIQQPAGSIAGHPGRMHDGHLGRPPAGRGHGQFRVVRRTPGEHRGLDPEISVVRVGFVDHGLHLDAVSAGEQVPEADVIAGGLRRPAAARQACPQREAANQRPSSEQQLPAGKMHRAEINLLHRHSFGRSRWQTGGPGDRRRHAQRLWAETHFTSL